MNISSCWVSMLPHSVQLEIHQELFNVLSQQEQLDTPDKLNEAIDTGMDSRLDHLEMIINVHQYVEKLKSIGWSFETRTNY